MALKPRQDIAGFPNRDRSKEQPLPLLYQRDLEDHERSPKVRARLQRVRAMLRGEAETR